MNLMYLSLEDRIIEEQRLEFCRDDFGIFYTEDRGNNVRRAHHAHNVIYCQINIWELMKNEK